MPKSIFPSGPAAFGSPLPALPSSRQAAPSQQAQQALVPQSQQQRLVSQHDQSMQRSPGLVPGQSTAGPSDTPTTASADDASGSAPGSRQSPRHGSVAASWTPMKASNDLPRQALENKLMRGKQLPPNSLIAAGLDPTISASTPRPQSIRRFKGQSAVVLLCHVPVSVAVCPVWQHNTSQNGTTPAWEIALQMFAWASLLVTLYVFLAHRKCILTELILNSSMPCLQTVTLA